MLTWLACLLFYVLQKEKYHTHLAVLYLDNVLQMRKDVNAPKSEMDLARSTLRHMLQESSVYRVPLILSKVRETDMHAECAILYGKVSFYFHEKWRLGKVETKAQGSPLYFLGVYAREISTM